MLRGCECLLHGLRRWGGPGSRATAGTALALPAAAAVTAETAELSFLSLAAAARQDYTGSDRDPCDPQSLHYLHPSGALTQYEQAISGVGRVLEMYDHDKVSVRVLWGGK